jgi:hypothetical protein
MKKEYFSVEKLNIIKKEKTIIFLRIFCLSFLFLLLSTLIFIFQNRNTMNLFILLGGLITSIYFVYLLIELKEFLKPLVLLKKLIEKSQKMSKVSYKIKFLDYPMEDETYLGISVKAIKVLEVDDKNTFIIYLDDTEKLDIDFDTSYSIKTYHNFLLSLEEINDGE